VKGERELRCCDRCRFCFIPQGVKRSATGRTIYDDESSVFFGSGSADYYADDTAREAAARKLAWVADHVAAPATLLDVGANVGFFCDAARHVFSTTGLEPNVHAVRWAREHLDAPVAAGSIYDPHPEFARAFDAITMFDVIEHLPDVQEAVTRCHAWLKPGGRLFITTPDRGSIVARILGRHWHYIDLDEHIALFTKSNLTTLLERHGFAVMATRSIGRRYRLSYIERRLAYLAQGAPLMRLAHWLAQPLRLVGQGSVTLSLGDVVGVVAERR
jgi:SAM-dependent methyltransferase